MKRVLLVLGLLLVTGLGAWFLYNFDLGNLASLSPGVMLVLFLITLAFMWNYAIGIRLVLGGMGSPVPLMRLYHVVMGASAASYVGNLHLSVPVRVFMFNRILGIPVGVTAGAIAVETLLWMAMMAAIVAVPMSEIWGPYVWLPSAAALAACVAGALGLAYFTTLGRLVPDRLLGIALAGVKTFFAEMHHGIRTIRPRFLALASASFAFNYLLDAVSLYLVLRELGFAINPFHLLYVIVLSYLAGTLSMIPMGLGTRDISFIVLLTQLGVPAEVATAAALIQRVLRTIIPLGLSLLSLNVLGLRHLTSASTQDKA